MSEKVKLCSRCNADENKKMPNGISPHATWCVHYRAPKPKRKKRFRGYCKSCDRNCNAPMFDGCMNVNCPHGFKPCA